MSNRLLFFIATMIVLGATNLASAATTSAAPVKADQNSPVLKISVDQYSEDIPKETLEKWVVQKRNLGLSSDYRSEFENVNYCPVSKFYCYLTLTSSDRQKMRLSSETIIDKPSIKAYVEDLARKVNRDPADAKFKVEDGKVATFAEAQAGITLDVEKSAAAIIENLSSPTPAKELSLIYDTKKADVNYSDVNNMGISSLIGEGTSNFKGSPSNRIRNIKVATARYNGILIKPGEEFSFVSLLGEVDADHGYLPELVIKNNATEPEFGGGICQVSTTVFRAAIYSGLKITARKNHAYPVSYYSPQGIDSTVYVPRPDLKFINNTPGYILIQTKIVGTQLTVSFYGTDDGRKTIVDGPTITERQPDGALKTTFSQKVIDKNNVEIINDVFNSSYNSPYKYPHPGGPVLSVKPSNWSDDEWQAYKKTLRDIAKAAAKS